MGSEARPEDSLLCSGRSGLLPVPFGGADHLESEVLLEPKSGWNPPKMEYRVKDILKGVKVRDLDNFLWLRIPEDTVARLKSDSVGERREILRSLAQAGVLRLWPKLPLHVQLTQASSVHCQGPPLGNAVLTVIGANPKQNDGMGISWAVIDTDVLASHEVFQGGNVDLYEVTKQGIRKGSQKSRSGSAHGSHVAGIIRTLAPAVKIVSIALPKVSNRPDDDAPILSGTGELEEALQWVSSQPDIQGVNISLGIEPADQNAIVGLQPGCAKAVQCVDQGKIVVVSAGNYGEFAGDLREFSITDPANARGVLVVGACAKENPEYTGIWTRSSRGPTADGRIKPDLVAPGIQICSCDATGNTKYIEFSGTSQAAAIVSGALAALMSRHQKHQSKKPSWWIEQLRKTCLDLGRDPTYQGKGMLKVDQADQFLTTLP